MTQKSEPAFDDAMLNSRIDTAKQDIAKQLAIDVSGVHVVTAEWVSWRTSALGCPKPDRGYLQVITPGVLIRLRAGEKIFRYHGSRNGDPFLCSAPGVPEDPAPGDPGGAHGQIDDGT